MKKITILATFALFCGWAMAQTPVTPVTPVAPGTNSGAVIPGADVPPPLPITTVEFSETVYNFTSIEQGVPVKHKFTFTNTGKNDLVINEVKRTCGCTSLDWTRTPVKPGESGWVEAEFNAANPGPFNKTVFFNANIDPNPVGLTFQGEVKKKEELNLNQNSMMQAQPGSVAPKPTEDHSGHNHPH